MFMARSCCAGAKVGTTVAAPSGLGSSSVCVPFLDTRIHRSTCVSKGSLLAGLLRSESLMRLRAAPQSVASQVKLGLDMWQSPWRTTQS